MIATCLKRLKWFFLAYEPMRAPGWEQAIFRVVLALLLWDGHSLWSTRYTSPLEALQLIFTQPFKMDIVEASQPHPSGMGMFIDFSFLSNDAIEQPLRALTALSLVLFMLGPRLTRLPSAISLLIPLWFGIGIATLRNSQGAIGHTAQAVHLVALSVWVASLWSIWQARRGRALSDGLTGGQFEMDLARQALSAAYVVSGITKLVVSKGAWIASTRYLPLHIVKNCDMEYYDTIKPEALKHDWLPQLMMDHPTLSSLLFGVALPLELFAFLGLYNRRAAALFGGGLICFHESVTRLMNLSFIYNKALLLVLFVAPWWWIAEAIRKRKIAQPTAP